jgi:3-hydroxyisobutyrate dehydrogenase
VQAISAVVEVSLKIGIAGTGRMGAALAGRLLGVGNTVIVWNRTAAKANVLAAAGATVAAEPREVATSADFIITILTDAAAIEATYHGARGLLAGEVGGKLFVDMSTVRPEVEKELERRVRARGAALIDCPVGGTVGPAKDGRLLGFVGGAADDVARARPMLEQLCRRVEHVGAVGAGASMKLAINLPLLVYYQALGEALSLCEGLDIEPARLIDIFADTSGGPNMLKVRGPAIAAALRGQVTTPVTFDIDLIRKDLRTMLEEAAGLGVDLPLAARALDCYDGAARDGLGASDATMLPAHWLREGGR